MAARASSGSKTRTIRRWFPNRRISKPSGKRSHESGRFSRTAKKPNWPRSGIAWCMAGRSLRRHCLIDDAVLRQLEAARVFAPLHVPAALSVIRFAQQHFPRLPQVACFDTAFHSRMPDVACTLPIPHDLRSDGIHRYGFHGLSCESVMRRLGVNRPDRIIIAHLGNGVSITAVKDGQSIDTSMGLMWWTAPAPSNEVP